LTITVTERQSQGRSKLYFDLILSEGDMTTSIYNLQYNRTLGIILSPPGATLSSAFKRTLSKQLKKCLTNATELTYPIVISG